MSYNNIPLFCYGSLVDVNQVPFKYRAIYQNYQGINRKKLFFGTYAKILCKRHYVNHRNGKRTRRRLSSHKDKIWGLACKHRPHICSFPTEVPGITKSQSRSPDHLLANLIFVKFHKGVFPPPPRVLPRFFFLLPGLGKTPANTPPAIAQTIRIPPFPFQEI